MAAHRYWRIYISATQTAGATPALAEIELRVGGADQTGSGAASASSEYSATYVASKAVDNDNATDWRAANGSSAPQWWQYDFGAGAEKDIEDVTLRCRSNDNSQMVKDFRIEYSDDGVQWSVGAAYNGEAAWSNGEVRTYDASVDYTAYKRRASTVFAYTAEQGGTARVSTVFAYSVHGPNARRVSTVFAYSVELESLLPDPPTAPVITAEATDWGEITVEMTGGGAGADTIALYGADDPADVPEEGPGAGADLLDGDWDGSAVVETGLGYGHFRCYRAYATNGAGTTPSNRPSATTAALPTPSVAAEADTPYQFTATITPAATATDHELYVGLSPTGLFVAGNLYADELGATPSPVAVTHRLENLTYYVGVRALFAGGLTSDSAIVSVTMPDDPDPALRYTALTDEGATFRLVNVDDADAEESQWEVAARADSTYAAPLWQSGTITEDEDETGRLLQKWYEGEAATQYRTHARYRRTGDPWPETWLEVLWETQVETPPPDLRSFWQSPAFGQVVSGSVCALIAVEDGLTISSILLSDDGGATWGAVAGTLSEAALQDESAGVTFWQFCFDSTLLADGLVRLRAVLSDGVTLDHFGFLIQNAEPVGEDPVFAYPYDQTLMKYYNEGQVLGRYRLKAAGDGYKCSAGGVTRDDLPWEGGELGLDEQGVLGLVPPCSIMWSGRVVGHMGYASADNDGPNVYGPTEPAWLRSNLGADVATVFYSFALGGGHRWEFSIPGELNQFGIGLFAQPGEWPPPVFFSVESYLLTTIYGARPHNWSQVGVGGGGLATLMVGAHQFTQPINWNLSWTYAQQTWVEQVIDPVTGLPVTVNCLEGSCYHKRAIPVRLMAERPDAVNYPRRWRVMAWTSSPYIPEPTEPGVATVLVGAPSSATDILFDETVDLDFDIPCGGIVFWNARPHGSNEENSGRVQGPYLAIPLETDCTAPEPPAPTIRAGVTTECYDALVTMDTEAANVEAVRYLVAAADDESFGSALDTGWLTPEYLIDPDLGETGTAYHLWEDLAAGSYLAKVEVQIGSTIYESAAVPFTILDLAVRVWGGWDNRVVTA